MVIGQTNLKKDINMVANKPISCYNVYRVTGGCKGQNSLQR